MWLLIQEHGKKPTLPTYYSKRLEGASKYFVCIFPASVHLSLIVYLPLLWLDFGYKQSKLVVDDGCLSG